MQIELEYIFRVIIAAICGLAIGYERAIQRKNAGIRTHILVAMAAALFMLVSKYGFSDILTNPGIDLDPSRIAAQIVSGISFLGAGAILVRKEQISGLTTAAGIWVTAAIGTAIGSGMYFIGTALTLLIVIIQFVFHDSSLMNFFIFKVHIHMQIDAINKPGIEEIVKNCLIDNGVTSINTRTVSISTDAITIQIDGITKNNYDQNSVMANLAKKDGILHVKTISDGK